MEYKELLSFKDLGIELYKLTEKGRKKDKHRVKTSYLMIEKYYKAGYIFRDEFTEKFLTIEQVQERFKDYVKTGLELEDLTEQKFMSDKYIEIYENGFTIKCEAPNWVFREFRTYMNKLTNIKAKTLKA